MLHGVGTVRCGPVCTATDFIVVMSLHLRCAMHMLKYAAAYLQSLKPEYAKAATALKSQGLDAALAKVCSSPISSLGWQRPCAMEGLQQ